MDMEKCSIFLLSLRITKDNKSVNALYLCGMVRYR